MEALDLIVTVNRTEIANKYDRQDVLSSAIFSWQYRSHLRISVRNVYEDTTKKNSAKSRLEEKKSMSSEEKRNPEERLTRHGE